ncbi:MAG: hypothetical protein NTV15_08715 [Candidatus Bathyarchaeota archaeon]|nr:hypothetical protein [Candidatus Bathyarchaeota archaeon]
MSEKGSSDSSAPISLTAGWVAYGAIAVVGVLSLFSLYMGFQNWSDDQQIAMMYMFIGSLGFASIGYMLFRSKAVSTQAKKELDIPKGISNSMLGCSIRSVRMVLCSGPDTEDHPWPSSALSVAGKGGPRRGGLRL